MSFKYAVFRYVHPSDTYQSLASVFEKEMNKPLAGFKRVDTKLKILIYHKIK